MVIRENKASFRPRARLVSILGEHLISDHVVGLLELVKNGYDADASMVRVQLLDTGSPETTCVVVSDDGFGMTTLDIVDRFLSPAVDHKARAKQNKQRTPGGRLPIGEKGVGRFAVQQLGRRLNLVTRAAGQPEVVVEVHWDAFDDSDTFLHEVSFPVVERQPAVFPGAATGTRLTVSHARNAWTEADVRKLQRGLRRLRSPLAGEGVGGEPGFRLQFSCPGFPQYESLDTGDILERAHYVFTALVDQAGGMDYEYRAAHPDRSVTHRQFEGQRIILQDASTELKGDAPSCGPFYLNLYVWDRSQQYLQQSGTSRADLDAMAGISLFRDHLRVLPYGEAGDDWLQLDRERINDPSRRMSNNQVVGFVEVSQADATALRDKTNREGLVENDAFRDLRAMVRAAISFFHTLWIQDRPKPSIRRREETGPAGDAAQRAREYGRAIAKTARPDVMVAVPPPVRKVPDTGAADPNGPRSAEEKPQFVTQRQAVRSLLGELDAVVHAGDRTNDEREAEQAILLHLASTGMAAERVVHEFSRQVVAALDAMDLLRRGGTESQAPLEILAACLGTLRNEFRVLAPYEGINRFQRTARVAVKDAVQTAVLLNREALDAGGFSVEVQGISFEVLARPASVIQVFDNLIHNATVWGAQSSAPPAIRIRLDAANRSVTVADTGPGVSPEVAPAIFEAFVTTRAGGRGLGLYITRSLMQVAGGTVHLCTDPSKQITDGANFDVDFSGFPDPEDGSR